MQPSPKLTFSEEKKQQPLTSVDSFLTTDSPAEQLGAEGALLLDPGRLN